MKKNGFIQIPLLLVIVAGFIILGGGSYFGIKQYQKIEQQKAQDSQPSNNAQTNNSELSEVEKLRQEVEELKKQSSENKNKVSTISKDITSIPAAQKSVLSNAQIISKIKPATVYIRTQKGAGSGVIFSADGYVLTNAHVVKGSTDVDVSLSTGMTLGGTVVGRNEIADLAVIKLITSLTFSKINFGDSDKVQQGDNVFTFGFPFGIEGDVSFKEGTISRRIQEYFEISAEIHPGNSGGPLVDRYGQVIGVNTAVFGKSVGGIQLGETIKLAIPINVAKNIISDLKLGKNVLPPKPPAFDEFTIFVKKNKLALELIALAVKWRDDAYTLAEKGRWSEADEKISEAAEAVSDAITGLESLKIPPVSFAQTIKELLSIEVQLYRFDYIIYSILQRAEYLAKSKLSNNIDIDEEIAIRTQVLNITKMINNKYDQRQEFFTAKYLPKLGEYVASAKPYLDIIYPKE